MMISNEIRAICLSWLQQLNVFCIHSSSIHHHIRGCHTKMSWCLLQCLLWSFYIHEIQHLRWEEFVNSLIQFWLFLSGSNDSVKSYRCITAVSCPMTSHWIPKQLTLALQFYLKQVSKLLFDWSLTNHTKLMTCNQLMNHASLHSAASTSTHLRINQLKFSSKIQWFKKHFWEKNNFRFLCCHNFLLFNEWWPGYLPCICIFCCQVEMDRPSLASTAYTRVQHKLET